MVGSELPMRRLELTAVMAALTREHDAVANTSERQVLSDFLSELTESGDGQSAFYHESMVMGGGWDDLTSITTLDAQVIPAVRAALATPAAGAATAPQPSNNV